MHMKDSFFHTQKTAASENNKRLYFGSDEKNEPNIHVFLIINFCIRSKNTRTFTATI